MTPIRFIKVAVMAIVLVLLMGASPAFADDATAPAAPVTVYELTPQMVAGLIGVLVPILVSLLSRVNASALVKTILNLALTAVTGAVAALVVTNPATGEVEFGWVPFLTAWVVAFVTSTASYLGGLKNLDLNNVLLAFGGLFGTKVQGAGVAGGVIQVGEHEVQTQDLEATEAEEFPPVDNDDEDLDDPVEGVDQ